MEVRRKILKAWLASPVIRVRSNGYEERARSRESLAEDHGVSVASVNRLIKAHREAVEATE